MTILGHPVIPAIISILILWGVYALLGFNGLAGFVLALFIFHFVYRLRHGHDWNEGEDWHH